jgi:hypothetical protein
MPFGLIKIEASASTFSSRLGCLLLQAGTCGAPMGKADGDLYRGVAHRPDAIHQVAVTARDRCAYARPGVPDGRPRRPRSGTSKRFSKAF